MIPPCLPTAAGAADAYTTFAARTFVFSATYFFAGSDKKAGIEPFLREELARFSEATGLRTKLLLDLVDLSRSGDGEGHNLLIPGIRDARLRFITEIFQDWVIATPPCNSWSRALMARGEGPTAVRCEQWPLGYPHLEGRDKDRANAGTSLVSFALEALHSATRAVPPEPWRACRSMIEHPEDLGAADKGVPASIWQLREARALSLLGAHRRGALHQCSLRGPGPLRRQERVGGSASVP